MDWLLFIDFSVTALCQCLLYTAIAVLLLRSRNRSVAEYWLVAFFGGMAGFTLMMFANASVYAPWSSYFASASQRFFLTLSLLALMQFAYRFPRYPASREAQVVLALSSLAVLGNLVWVGLSITTPHDDFFIANQTWSVIYSLIIAGELLWSIIVLLRQTVRLSRAESAEAAQWWWQHLLHPQGRPARGTRGFAATFLLLLLLALLAVATVLNVVSSDTLIFFLNLILLAIPFLFALTYLNTTPETTTFMDKLVLVVLVISLAALNLAGIFTIGHYSTLYGRLREYDVQQIEKALTTSGQDALTVLSASTLPTTTVYVIRLPLPPFETPDYELLYSASEVFSARFADNQRRSVQAWTLAVVEQAEALQGEGVPAEAALTQARTLLGPTFWIASEELYVYWNINDGGILRYYYYPLTVNGQSYLVGFEQRAYREAIHSIAARLVYLILWFTGFLVVILPAFFRANLVRPLNQLLEGVRQVNAGERQVTVSVQFADEIGFLTQSFNQMVASLREADRLKDEFLANTSHELRTPLNGIIGLTESLIDGAGGPLTPVQAHSLSLVIVSGRRLATLVNDLLDFAKLRHHDLQLQRKPFDLMTLTDLVLQISKPLVGDKPVQIFNQLPADLPLVDGDENRVQQILYNLIGNAIKFTETGEVRVVAGLYPSITEARAQQRPLLATETPPAHGVVAVTVIDTGIGIAADKLDVIFESFQQADGSVARQFGGAGLGLALARQLVDLHGGQLWVESTLGKGSQFTFTLPLAPHGAQAAPTITPAPVARVSQPEAPEKKGEVADLRTTPHAMFTLSQADQLTMDGEFRVLLVDDDLVNLQVLHNHLNYGFLTLVAAQSGPEALEIIQREAPFHLVLLDVMMPRMSGYEVTRALRRQYPPNELPIILLTAKNQVEDLVEGFVSGASDYVTKPVSKGELLARVKTHLRLTQIVSSNEVLRQANTLKTELIGIAAHDLKNPLSSVIGYTQFIMEFPLERDVLEMAEAIDRAARQMLEIIQHLLQDAALESGQLQLNIKSLDLKHLAETVQRRRTPQAALKQQKLVFNVQEQLVVEGDEPHLLECMDNLVENAIKYSPVQTTIWVTLAVSDGFARYEVRDEGLGMSEADLQKVFGKFQKLSARPTGGESSSGLGLHIVKRVVELHKGRVWVDSTGKGQGSTFTILLPLKSPILT